MGCFDREKPTCSDYVSDILCYLCMFSYLQFSRRAGLGSVWPSHLTLTFRRDVCWGTHKLSSSKNEWNQVFTLNVNLYFELQRKTALSWEKQNVEPWNTYMPAGLWLCGWPACHNDFGQHIRTRPYLRRSPLCVSGSSGWTMFHLPAPEPVGWWVKASHSCAT